MWGMRMFVWSKKPSWLAVAQARTVEEARHALLTNDNVGESGDGSCPVRDEAREYILTTQPVQWLGVNGEFALTDSAELQEQEDYTRKQNAEIQLLKRTLASVRADLVSIKEAAQGE